MNNSKNSVRTLTMLALLVAMSIVFSRVLSISTGFVRFNLGSLPVLLQPLFVNVNDGTNEGLVYKGKNIFTVQFHPEACPGPQDSGFLFDRFLENIKEGRNTAADGKEAL